MAVHYGTPQFLIRDTLRTFYESTGTADGCAQSCKLGRARVWARHGPKVDKNFGVIWA